MYHFQAGITYNSTSSSGSAPRHAREHDGQHQREHGRRQPKDLALRQASDGFVEAPLPGEADQNAQRLDERPEGAVDLVVREVHVGQLVQHLGRSTVGKATRHEDEAQREAGDDHGADHGQHSTVLPLFEAVAGRK